MLKRKRDESGSLNGNSQGKPKDNGHLKKKKKVPNGKLLAVVEKSNEKPMNNGELRKVPKLLALLEKSNEKLDIKAGTDESLATKQPASKKSSKDLNQIFSDGLKHRAKKQEVYINRSVIHQSSVLVFENLKCPCAFCYVTVAKKGRRSRSEKKRARTSSPKGT